MWTPSQLDQTKFGSHKLGKNTLLGTFSLFVQLRVFWRRPLYLLKKGGLRNVYILPSPDPTCGITLGVCCCCCCTKCTLGIFLIKLKQQEAAAAS
ncbi:hypothetical protein H5410_053250 [Solanum commersonii]|uniref:Uncharacterized protein n=1 Tax=Solanum commersonii TaxID=4109 RepID=A0A9J5X4E0_SOLCO|nr:hypothetical protein H5410_053250 [Solanum commersonii]